MAAADAPTSPPTPPPPWPWPCQGPARQALLLVAVAIAAALLGIGPARTDADADADAGADGPLSWAVRGMKRKRVRRARPGSRNWAVHGPGVGQGKMKPTDITKAMLDDLMGPDRNEPSQNLASRKQIWDEDVDKYFLAGLSPYEVLRGTNKDAPVCLPGIEEWDKVCYPALRREFQSLPQIIRDAYGYEYELWRLLKDVCGKMDLLISKRREEMEGRSRNLTEAANIQNVFTQTRDDIEILRDKMAKAEEEGNVDALFAYKAQIEEAESRKTLNLGILGIKQQFVCNISGLSYFSTDNEDRLRSLYEGRAWQAWKKVRDMFAILNAKPQKPGVPGYKHLNLSAINQTETIEGFERVRQQKLDRVANKSRTLRPPPFSETMQEILLRRQDIAQKKLKDLIQMERLRARRSVREAVGKRGYRGRDAGRAKNFIHKRRRMDYPES